MPVRTIRKNYRNVTGILASTKAVGSAQFESTLERDFLTLLEFSPEVSRFEVQPVTLDWLDPKGTSRRYTPDVLVNFHPSVGHRPWLCEVKYRSAIKDEWSDLRPKFRQSIRFAKNNGWRFRLMTEIEIRTPLLANAKFLLPYRQQIIPADKADRVLKKLAEGPAATPEQLLHALVSDAGQQAEWLPSIWHLLANGRIGADLHTDLSMASPIWSLP